jgi:cytochrome c-type biogenesis protein CcmE
MAAASRRSQHSLERRRNAAAMKKSNQRLISIGIGLAALGVAAALTLNGLRDSVTFFYSPTEVYTKQVKPGTKARLGGLVEMGSLVQKADGAVVFKITDNVQSVSVSYRGLLPDLFREGQGVVTEGQFGPGGQFVAARVLAKHDETYMPKEVVDALKKSGKWKPGEGGMQNGMQTP